MLVINVLFVVTAVASFYIAWKLRGVWDRWRKS